MSGIITEKLDLGFTKLFLLRFCITYFPLYVLYDLTSRFANTTDYSFKYFDALIDFIGFNLFGLSRNFAIHSNGVLDSSYHYIVIIVLLSISLLVGIIWTLRRKDVDGYKKHLYLVALFLRFYLAFILINYGLVKMVYLQFPEPSLLRLVQTYGNSSPMGLAWTFFGYSKGYNLFLGVAEVLSVLLLFKRTLVVGLIITFFVSLNVMMVNFFYDVPLKIHTVHLLLITLFLLSSSFKSLYSFLVKGRMTSLKTLKAPNGLKEYNAKIIFTSIKYVFILLIIIFAGLKLFKRDAALNGDFKKSKFYGIYKVVEFKKNGNKASFSIEELKEIWKYFVMEYNGRVQIVDFNDDVTHYKSRIDSISNVIYLDAFNISKDSIRIHYRINENNGITFRLKNELDSLEIRCNILKEKDFLLMQRGFHLINEEAYYN